MNAEDSIRRIIREVTGQDPEALEAMPYGHTSRTFLATLPDGRVVVVRTNDKPAVFAATGRNLEVLSGLGLPVPTVLASDLSCSRYPFAYIVADVIPGRDLRYELAAMSRSQMTTLAGQLVAFQRRVGSLPPGEGFGYTGIGEAGQCPNWSYVVTDSLEEIQPATEPLRSWRIQIAALICERETYLRAVPSTCFLDDITVKNVIVKDGELQGLVDFDCVCYGDPLWWIGLTAAGVLSDVGEEPLFYVDELCHLYGLTPEQERVVPLYCAMHAARFVGLAGECEEAVWQSRMAAGVERWITTAGGRT